MPESLPVITDPPVDHSDVVTWVQSLGGPVWIELSGVDNDRCRVITTLLHGNEPSGILALHRWLAERPQPQTRLAVLVANVAAALAPPHFTQRIAPGGRDLNRCFRPPYEDASGMLAEAITHDIMARAPECVIDLHNTSGNGPSFAVATHCDPCIERLAGRFCDKLIVTDFRLGSLMELPFAFPLLSRCPMFTLECGGALQPAAVEVAGAVYRKLAEWPSVTDLSPNPALEVLAHPLRVELKPGVRIAYAHAPQHGAQVTLWSRIDAYNRGVTSPEVCLGWLGEGGLANLQARDARGEERIRQLLCERDGKLYPRRPLRLFMATTNAEIARSDCLFYAVPY
ncbi:succinylglutamate desuccinylase [Halomonas campisalis]|uniref:Succinylglutamate desuccinylase n=1 Tax=Billgrantia campisalis TaxID=74661 RepID=A0ABS9P6Z3_9GAMM|nr:succinylglutamate desuccinylase/aspartoacylase family protein [Halomonas campisalis]MCG6657560.1 succinylglutamate desuccinylase [Halomonas campisalis]MDR5862666.1 succinylglutamate desuccinylase/aspartoacylase family protein [Halomonas campisalis]